MQGYATICKRSARAEIEAECSSSTCKGRKMGWIVDDNGFEDLCEPFKAEAAHRQITCLSYPLFSILCSLSLLQRRTLLVLLTDGPRPVPCEKQCLGVVLFDHCARNNQFTNYWMQFTAEQ